MVSLVQVSQYTEVDNGRAHVFKNKKVYIWNGTNEFVSFVINSGRKFSIGVKCEVNVKK
jgi:hypothetical protein